MTFVVDETRPAGELADIARILGEDWERATLAAGAEGVLSLRPFVADWPALVRWRDRVLADRQQYPPDVVAAALEALALECALSGHPELAQRAVQRAEHLVIGRARRDGHRRTTPQQGLQHGGAHAP